MSDELLDALRNIFLLFWFCCVFTGVFVIGSNYGLEKFEIDIKAFRLQQFEASGKSYGSKAWKVLNDVVSINESVLRKCAVVPWKELMTIDFEAKFQSTPVGAVLIILPNDLGKLSVDETLTFLDIEQRFASLHTELAVYFAEDSPLLRVLLKSVQSAPGNAPTALQQFWSALMADNFQIASSNGASSNVASNKVFNVIAHLNAAERGRPYLFIVAHYDTYGTIPSLGIGSDSNGSGTAVLLELLAILSQIYSLPSHKARYNLVFVLSAGGKFSYQGSRSFIDDFNERHSDERIALAICLDSLARGDSLFVHASKIPSDETKAFRFIQTLRHFAKRPVELISKKISLASDRLAWEHEIYNIRRIHAVTISHFSNHSDPFRNSLLDIPTSLDFSVLEANAKLIANSLVSFVFDLDSRLCNNAKENNLACSLLNDAVEVDPKRLKAWVSMFGSKSRPIVVSQHRLVTNLFEVVKRLAHSAHVSEIVVNDFALYDIVEDILTATIVKPAIFELILASCICIYLYFLYCLSMHAQFAAEATALRIRRILSQ
ncbi:hypothetical protein niasHT_010032 [Heterodera trifolii]|uniref:BOS complex subunit NCLN n=1 Tax=Heterodera trifolii TaxID=157864 RepID=A0ABD2MBR1_9BILA